MESRRAWITSDSPINFREVPTWATKGEILKWHGRSKHSTHIKAISWGINSRWKCKIQPLPRNIMKACLKAFISCPRILRKPNLTTVLWIVPIRTSKLQELDMVISFRESHTISCKEWIKGLNSKILRGLTLKLVTLEFESTKRGQWQPRTLWISSSTRTSPL